MSDDESAPPSRPPSPPSALPNTARPYRFTWDPANRAESVSGTTEGFGANQDYAPRLGLYPSTLNLALAAVPQEWSSATHGFHGTSQLLLAISTVLNNPHKRQAPPKAHSHLPPVAPADLPRVRRKDFDAYLRVIAPEWENFRPSSDNTQSTPKPVPPIDHVPQVFFSQTFSLSDPRTFSAVTEDADPTALAHALPLLDKFSHYADTVEQHLVLEISHRAPSFFAALTNLHDLHAESEHCLDRIASLRRLLTDLDTNTAKKGLHLVSKQVRTANVVSVSQAVKQVASVTEMARLARALVGAGQWGQALAIIDEIDGLWQSQSPNTATSDEIKPLPPLSSSKPSMPTLTEEDEDAPPPPPKKPPPIPLSQIHAYAALPDHLASLTMEIAASLSLEFVSILREDLVQPKNTNAESNLRDRLRPPLQGLIRTRGLKEGLLSWREIILGEIRQLVRSRLPQDDATEEAKAANRTHFRSMPHPEFMLFLQELYADLLRYIEGLQSQTDTIVDILETEIGKVKELGTGSSTSTSLTPSQAHSELTDILATSAELANTQSAALIALRIEEHTALPLADFLTLFTASWAFVVRCEVLSRRMIVGLRGAVVGQAKAFLQAFHQARISKSAKLVEDEQWNQVEVTVALQGIVDAVVDSAVRDAPELVIKQEGAEGTGAGAGAGAGVGQPPVSSYTPAETPPAHLLQNANANANTNGSSHATNGTGAGGFAAVKAPGSKHLRIEDRTYFAVSATTEVLVLLLDYLRVVVNLTMLTTDVMSRVIEFLKAFNSRTCQVVLGAGAMRSAGLKNITAKHLALASQSLSIMFELIPYVRETFRRHLSPKQAVMLVEFDKLKRDYQEHQNEIHSKLIAIMGDRLNAHIKDLQAVDWNVPKPGGGVNGYMEVLVKETVTLHKVLSRYLSAAVVEFVMTQVFAAINHGLSEEYSKIILPHQEAKTRLLADAKYLHQKLSGLKNVAAPSGMLMTVISEKRIGNAPPSPLPVLSPKMSPVPTPMRSSTISLGASANQRLKGLLSGKSSTFEKALPTPMRSASLLSPPAAPRGAENGNGDMNIHEGAQTRKASAGFKQVELASSDVKPPESGPVPVPVDASTKELDGGGGQGGQGRSQNQQERTLVSPLPPTPHDSPSPEPPAATTTEPDSVPVAQSRDQTNEKRGGVEGRGSGGEEGAQGGELAPGVGNPALVAVVSSSSSSSSPPLESPLPPLPSDAPPLANGAGH
ncbi:hypothetical protein H0H92_014836 [Tricholoma furcatifolium]|nr:hypothetical protein H0H92_014836 [Tricholoma furcatifolium]